MIWAMWTSSPSAMFERNGVEEAYGSSLREQPTGAQERFQASNASYFGICSLPVREFPRHLRARIVHAKVFRGRPIHLRPWTTRPHVQHGFLRFISTDWIHIVWNLTM